MSGLQQKETKKTLVTARAKILSGRKLQTSVQWRLFFESNWLDVHEKNIQVIYRRRVQLKCWDKKWAKITKATTLKLQISIMLKIDHFKISK